MTASAFDKFYRKYRYLILGVCSKYASAEHSVDDLTQEVWLRVWRFFDKIPGDNSNDVAPWITTVADRVCKTYLRNNEKRAPQLVSDSQLTATKGEEDDEAVTGSWIEETAESPYDTVEEFETLDQLVYAGSTLSEQEAAVFNLVYWHGKSYDFVAKKFGISKDTIGPIVTRLRDKIERGMRPSTDVPRYYPPGNVWGDWSWKPEGLANQRMG